MEQDTKKTDFAEQNEPTAQPQEAAQQGGEVAEAYCKSHSKPKENGPMTAQQRHANAARRRERELAELTEKIRVQEKERFEKELQTLLVPQAADASNKSSSAKTEGEAFKTTPKREPFDASDAPQPGGAEESEEKKAAPQEEAPVSQTPDGISQEGERETLLQRQTALREELDAVQREKIALSLEHELAEVQRLNPAISDVKALCRMEEFPKFYDFVIKNGLTFAQAYRLTFGDKLQKDAAQAAQKTALDAERGLAHLGKTASCGSLQSDVPAEQMELFCAFCPELSADQIRSWYQKNKRD